MREVLVDTNVISYLLNRHPFATPCREYLLGKLPLTSFITLGELYRGALERSWVPRGVAELEALLAHYVMVPSDIGLSLAYGRVGASAKRNGRPIDAADVWIAATALLSQVPLLTHNRGNSAGVDGLQVVAL